VRQPTGHFSRLAIDCRNEEARGLRLREHGRSSALERRDERRPHARVDHQVILGAAHQAVVERLALHDAPRDVRKVGVGSDERRLVSRPHANGGLPRSIGRINHGSPASGQHHAHLSVAHQRRRGLARVLFGGPLHEGHGRAHLVQDPLDHQPDLL
jgi:hypothetical protein